MNIYYILAGGIGTLGGFAHAVLGDTWTVSPIDSERIASRQNTGEQNKRYIRWFWHVGSVVLLSTSILFLLEGLQVVALHRHLQYYLSFLWVSTTLVFFGVTLKPPVQSFRMIPGLVGIPVNALLLAGLFLR